MAKVGKTGKRIVTAAVISAVVVVGIFAVKKIWGFDIDALAYPLSVIGEAIVAGLKKAANFFKTHPRVP